jgi:hypothetical protein
VPVPVNRTVKKCESVSVLSPHERGANAIL